MSFNPDSLGYKFQLIFLCLHLLFIVLSVAALVYHADLRFACACCFCQEIHLFGSWESTWRGGRAISKSMF
uniref:Putative secreted protein n=1 Tax=Ixodes ricinus TaxID=34613 RepID=A0A6B0U0C4_IXORI